jgi:Icc protein
MPNLIQITDTHLFGAADGRLGEVNVDRTLSQVVDSVCRHRPTPDLILATGDFVQEETPAAYARVADHLQCLPAPVICLPGNHDDCALLDTICDGVRIARPRSHALGQWQLVLLDSTQPGDNPVGHLAEAELAALEASLAAAPDQPTLVCLHHPPLSIGSAWMDPMMVDNGNALLDRLQPHRQVRAVVFGHVHQEFDLHAHGTQFLAAPSTCLQFKPRVATAAYDTLSPGYRWFDLQDGGHMSTGIKRIQV